MEEGGTPGVVFPGDYTTMEMFRRAAAARLLPAARTNASHEVPRREATPTLTTVNINGSDYVHHAQIY